MSWGWSLLVAASGGNSDERLEEPSDESRSRVKESTPAVLGSSIRTDRARAAGNEDAGGP